MPEQDSLLHSEWWYSLVAASPTPENGEQANVAVVVGNGQASHIRFKKNLPRLSGLAAPDLVQIFERVLGSVKERVDRGLDVATLRSMIGPQMRVMERVALFQQPSDELLDRLVRRYLESPRPHADEEEDFEAIHLQSNAIIDVALRRVSPQFSISEDATFKDLYGVRSVGVRRIPRIARVIRSVNRDVLLDGVAVTPARVSAALREGAAQIGKAFYDYNTLRSEIRLASGKEIMMIGFLHHDSEPEPVEVTDANNYIRQVWRSSNAEVIDAGVDTDVVEEAIERSAEWLRGGPSG
jgi:hypothetical protein